jgi:hypothetical protein
MAGHTLSSSSQLALLRYSFVLLVQISDPIFELAVIVALWKVSDNYVRAGRSVQVALGRPISHDLADAKFAGWHRLASELRDDREWWVFGNVTPANTGAYSRMGTS